MDEVIESCQVPFEEDGVNSQTLDDLRKVSDLDSSLVMKIVVHFLLYPPFFLLQAGGTMEI